MPAEKQVKAVMDKLKELDQGFDGNETHVVGKGSVVTELRFRSDKVMDISPVRALTGLQTLDCHGSQSPAAFCELEPLRGLRLTSLNCSRTKVSDLSALKDMKLTELDCGFTNVGDLSPLKDMKLTILVCTQSPVSDLSPLTDMKLTALDCSGTRVIDLSPLKGMPLTNLNCGNNAVSDLTPLKGMKLTEFNICSTQVADLTPLKDMPLSILAANAARKIKDLSPLKGMKLINLGCWGTSVSDLTPLQGMPLTGLECHATQVIDLSPLKGLPLKSLTCDFKPERDTEILQAIKTLESINYKPAKEILKAVTDKPIQPVDDAWLKQVAAMPAEKQVKAVMDKLKDLNPDFDGKETHVVGSGGVVTDLQFSTVNVSDISPVRALVGLQMLNCRGSEGNGRFADLSPLKDMKLTTLDCYKNEGIRPVAIEGHEIDGIARLRRHSGVRPVAAQRDAPDEPELLRHEGI